MRIYKRISTLGFDEYGNCNRVLREGSTPVFTVINTHTYEDLLAVVKRDNPDCNIFANWTGNKLISITFVRDDEFHGIFVI